MTAPDHEADVLRAGVAGTAADVPAHAPDQTRDDGQRLQLFAYLQAPEHRTYLAIMRLFTSTLLADLSAGEVGAALAAAEREGRVAPGESDVDTVIDRLKRLVKWGNLVVGRRETIASSIAEFQHGSVRYQVSKLAVRVQRDVDALLRVPEGAREVSRELLPAIDRGLAGIGSALSEALSAEVRDPRAKAARQARERLAEQVTTVFLQHAELAATVRDFYAYLGQVVTRHQLAPEEISGFRNLLVEYIQMVVEDVLRHTETIAGSLAGLAGVRGELLRLLGPADQLGTDVERARGRTAADWQELTDWFVDSPGRPSQVAALREATARAIGSLLASVKRATSGGGLVPGRRGELLKLAKWFDGADEATAHQLHSAAFGLHSARHLQPAPDYDTDNDKVSWRDGPVLDVTVSVRSRGDRGARGRTSRVLDDPMTEETLLAQAREADQKRSAAVAELAAAGPRLAEQELSPDALGVLCELLTLAMAQREGSDEPGTALDPVHRLRVTVRPAAGQDTEIASAAGRLTLRDTVLELSGDGAIPQEQGAAR
ncbi:TIGR02677 family protein [Saccharopolyspora kobensis]|uniref:TIGR02677 family protein n=2 Tax=Saccharopolyspora kobensis TaxID=146035 RepID=A0A1H6E6X3_9PSEU|nr:TIGR02677 family protein [Saccharopolyspora kobensis]SEG93480.1 TIGR02677 family protein [Saccharopolyspora kobensis]SFD45631.1 TIGR02677 family protein [Saccharopolyspora kobensis]